MNKNKRKVIEEACEEIYRLHELFYKKHCEKCVHNDECFPRGYLFDLKKIEKCERVPKIFKIFFKLKEEEIILVEFPFEIKL